MGRTKNVSRKRGGWMRAPDWESRHESVEMEVVKPRESRGLGLRVWGKSQVAHQARVSTSSRPVRDPTGGEWGMMPPPLSGGRRRPGPWPGW